MVIDFGYVVEKTMEQPINMGQVDPLLGPSPNHWNP
jgi:hypothetical protein